jgi:hypothetical protein
LRANRPWGLLVLLRGNPHKHNLRSTEHPTRRGLNDDICQAKLIVLKLPPTRAVTPEEYTTFTE